jgi:hypothetical protein
MLASAIVAASLALLATAAAAGPPGTWTQITHGINGARANLGLARGKDGTLHVLYGGPGRAPYTAILDAPISPSGAVGAAEQVLSGWSAVHPPDAVTAPDGSIHTIVSGARVGTIGDPTSGLNDIVGPGSWQLPAQAFGNASVTEASNTDPRTAALRNGQLVTVWTTGLSFLFAVGSDPATPPQQLSPLGANGVIAVDQGSGDAIIAYKAVQDGQQYFRRVVPSVDPPVQIPQAQKDEGVQIAARAGGGVYTAYTPDFVKVWLVRFGGKPTAVPEPKGAQVNTAGVTAGPDGRLWVYYGNGLTTWVTRTSRSVSGWEPVQAIKNPPGVAQYFRIEGEGSAGPLDLFVDLVIDGQQKDGTYHTQVHPELSLRASAKAGRVTVTVTDAGDPVAGAKVTGLPGGAKATDAKGSLVVPGRKGTFTITATKAGYVPARGKVSA